MKRPELEAAKARRRATRTAIRAIRDAHQTRQTPILMDLDTGRRAVAVAVRILEGRCRLTGEDPAAVLDDLDAAV